MAMSVSKGARQGEYRCWVCSEQWAMEEEKGEVVGGECGLSLARVKRGRRRKQQKQPGSGDRAGCCWLGPFELLLLLLLLSLLQTQATDPAAIPAAVAADLN